ncbi:MAG: uracil-DNA glycosylase [Campylobacter sp.]|nr:uracil-DNA glycosylase [Campylobacter sp.]
MQIKLENVKIEKSWKNELRDEFLSPYFLQIKENLINAKKNEVVFPPSELIFNAFNITPFDEVKVVILGQDPYHGINQAMGLSFSVPKGVKIPPSLINIFKELQMEFGYEIPKNGDLTNWAKQGVLLLNSSLSVAANKPNSHSKFGWQIFTDSVIKILSQKRQNLVFMLWGNYAKAKANLIDENCHLVLKAAHPSPLAGGAFFGCNHFKKCNEYLQMHGKIGIKWDLNS